jgi:putative serine/threonine protein kinase
VRQRSFIIANISVADGARKLKDLAIVTIEALTEEPYPFVLCYPKPTADELQKRLNELELHGVTAIEFTGKANAFNVPVLGKGYVGIVVKAQRYGQDLALKIRRVDADRADLFHEAEMLKKANSAGVGPTFVNVSKNFLLMQLIEGVLLPAWLSVINDKTLIRQVLSEVLEQCWQLDTASLDHGELSKAPKHIIVDYDLKPWIVDFETSSNSRKTANVTAICQYLTMSGGYIPQRVAEVLGERDRKLVIKTLRNYKKGQTRDSLDEIIKVCLY